MRLNILLFSCFSCLLLFLSGCQKELRQPPYTVIASTVNSDFLCQAFDMNGDGVLEIATSYIATSQPRITISSHDLQNTFEQINIRRAGNFQLWHTDTGELRAGVITEEDFTAWYREYDQEGVVLKQVKLRELTDVNETGKFEGQLQFIALGDGNNDGIRDAVFSIGGGYDKQDRVILCLDRRTFSPLWQFDHPGCYGSAIFHRADVTFDGVDEILFASTACATGAATAERNDHTAYITALSLDGSVAWERELGGKFTTPFTAAPIDLDGDGRLEIACIKRNHNMGREADGLFILDAHTGEIERRLVTEKRYNSSCVVADIDNDTRPEILAIRRDSILEIYNHELELEDTLETNNKAVALLTATDMTGDGYQEIVFRSSQGELLFYSHQGELLATYPYAENGISFSYPVYHTSADLNAPGNALFFGNSPANRLELKKTPQTLLVDYGPVITIAAFLAATVLLVLLIRLQHRHKQSQGLLEVLSTAPSGLALLVIGDDNSLFLANSQAYQLLPTLRKNGAPAALAKSNDHLEMALISSLEKLRNSHDLNIDFQASTANSDRQLSNYQGSVHQMSFKGRPCYVVQIVDASVNRELGISEEGIAIGQEVMHRIKTLDSVIRSDVDYLRRTVGDTDEGRTGEVLDELQVISDKIAILSREYIKFSRLKPETLEHFDLHELIRHASDLITERESRGIEIELELDQDRALIHGSRRQLEMVLENVLKNALEACQPEDRVRIETIVKQDANDNLLTGSLLLTISDTGSGMDQDMINRIRETGYSTKEHGSGIGLQIVKRIVSLHGGRFSIESTVGQGTAVKITLPLA